MAVVDEVLEVVRQLPEPRAREVLEFAQLLRSREPAAELGKPPPTLQQGSARAGRLDDAGRAVRAKRLRSSRSRRSWRRRTSLSRSSRALPGRSPTGSTARISMRTGSARFLDSNDLTYAYDVNEPERQPRALAVLSRVARLGTGVVSTQNLAEFWVATRRLRSPLPTESAARRVRQFCRLFRVTPVDPEVVHEAIRGVRTHQLFYWDAQLWASARLNDCAVILTEDLPGRPEIEGVRFVNPLLPDFDLDSLA
jgi:predicted nucleic acid-binding protein